MNRILKNQNLHLRWGDVLGNTVTISYTINEGAEIIIDNSAPNQSVDEGYYDWVVDVPMGSIINIKVVDNDDPSYFIQFDPIRVFERKTSSLIKLKLLGVIN